MRCSDAETRDRNSLARASVGVTRRGGSWDFSSITGHIGTFYASKRANSSGMPGLTLQVGGQSLEFREIGHLSRFRLLSGTEIGAIRMMENQRGNAGFGLHHEALG